MPNENLDELQKNVTRLICQSAALLHVLRQTPAADGEAILSPTRWEVFENRLRQELAAKGLDLGW